MKVMLSIKPEYAERIFSGQKRYEYRRVLFKKPNISKVVVYESAPTSKVVGEFEVSGILSAPPDQLWQTTRNHSGIDKAFFFTYFADCEMAYAIKVKNPVRYQKALDLRQEFALSMPPQSFAYLP